MPNVFDQFDATTRAPANAFDQFDVSAGTRSTSQLGALVEGVKSGASAGFSDEITGALAASGIPQYLEGLSPTIRNGVIRALFAHPLIAAAGIAGGAGVGGARVGYEQLTGENDPTLSSLVTGERPKGEATKRYETARDEARGVQKAAQAQYPKTYLAGQVGGALALPGGSAVQGATLPLRIARGAVVGGLQGAAAGFGEGEGLPDSATKAATGAAIGAGLGSVAAPVVEGVIQGTRALTAPITRAVRGAINPEGEAARRVVGAIERDIANDPTAVERLTAQEFRASQAQPGGGPATIMDLGGETTRALARSAANTSPEGRALINRTIDDRFEDQTPRIVTWLRDTFNYPNAAAQQQAIETTARNVNRASYARAYREGAAGLWSPELERLAGSDAVSSAMQSAARKAKDEAIVSGYGAMNPRITFTPDGRIQFNRGPNGVPTYPDLQYWDLVRREISDAAQNAGRGTSEARRLNSFASALNTELDRLVPSYQQARQGAAHFFGAENALEAGQNFVTARLGNAEARQALARMSPTERQLFQDGFVSRFIETLEATGDRRNVLNQIASSPMARERLYMVLGRQRATELEAGLRVEGIMDLARGAVQGNSTTARQLAELGFAGGAGGLGVFGTYNLDPTQITSAAMAAALLAGRRNIDQRVARRVAEMLTSRDPAVLARGVRMVARNERLIDALRSADRRLAGAGGQQAGNVPLLQAGGVGRAQDNEPNVPRPPGQ